MQEAAELAKNSMIFAAVSPGMDQAMATDGLVSIIKAYDIDVEDTLDGIISKVNEVGKILPNGIAICRKKVAISVKGWGQQRPRKDLVFIYFESLTTVIPRMVTYRVSLPPY